MTTMISEVYEAFRVAGVPDTDAKKAAEALSSENLATKKDIVKLDRRMDNVETRLSIIEKLLWIVIAGVIGVLIKLFV